MRASLPIRASRAHTVQFFSAQTLLAQRSSVLIAWKWSGPNPPLPRSYATQTSLSQSRPALSRENANPPASTRPAPIDLPERKPDTSTFSYLFATGKAYLNFYKTGLKNIYGNWQLIRNTKEPSATRSRLQLETRTQHDLRRLPMFGILLLICGEFTPFVVLVVPSLVPFTCRIPKQIDILQRKAENRRKQSFADFLAASQSAGKPREELPVAVTTGHIARSLGLVGSPWDRIGPWAPMWLSQRRVDARLRFLVRDDTLLLEAGGVPALESSEVRLACAERGINVLGRSEEELSAALEKWLSYTGRGGDTEASLHNAVNLLTQSEDQWPTAK